jgi:hypothetical protein
VESPLTPRQPEKQAKSGLTKEASHCQLSKDASSLSLIDRDIMAPHCRVEGQKLPRNLASFGFSSFGTFPVQIGTSIGNGSFYDDEVSPSRAIPHGTKSSLTIC